MTNPKLKQKLRESLINLLKSADESNIELAYTIGEGQKINVDVLVKSIYGILLNEAKGKTVKDMLLYLPNMEELWLTEYDLTSIPEGIENLTNLKWLHLQANKLTSLKGIENLTNLERLDLDNNELTSLKGIENLTNLKWLYVDNNKLIITN